jgi:hypothetical protein
MDEMKLLLIAIIFSLAQFDLVIAGPESQVFSDLINLHFDEKMEWKNEKLPDCYPGSETRDGTTDSKLN